jgi:hypothetical protein
MAQELRQPHPLFHVHDPHPVLHGLGVLLICAMFVVAFVVSIVPGAPAPAPSVSRAGTEQVGSGHG